MLKRTSSGGTPKANTPKNTLFNYFKKSPAQCSSSSKKSSETPVDNSPKAITKSNAKKLFPEKKAAASDSDDEETITSRQKRRRLIVDSDDSDTENTTTNNAVELKKEVVAKKPRLDTKFTFKSTKESEEVEEESSEDPRKSGVIDKSIKEEIFSSDLVTYIHETLDFLKPNKIKDAAGRRPEHPDYDHRTLYVPPAYLNTLTPAMRQYWIIKSQHYDCVIFYKVGKFYELYHMDATVGVQELGFSYMKGDFAHSGFPESAYDRMATNLVERGYKVVRVEQTETPEMMAQRCKTEKTTSKFDKVVKREVCQVTQKGTQVYGQQSQMTLEHKSNFMLTLSEKDHGTTSRYGICFIDTSLGEFHLSEFEDDKHSSRLLTYLSHEPPILVLHPRHGLSLRTQQILKNVLANVKKEPLQADVQMWSAEKTLKMLVEKYYTNPESWPEALQPLREKSDNLGLTPEPSWALALRALGGCIWYLSGSLLDQQILDMAQFSIYVPSDLLATASSADLESQVAKQLLAANNNRHMVLDSVTIANLRITGDSYSLLATLDHCCTKFGKRLLQNWVCSPSCELAEIRRRQEAVTELLDNNELLQELRLMLGALPDLERNLAQIHALGNKKRHTPSVHPDARAILYEELTYGKKKVQDFINTLNGFERLLRLPKLFAGCESALLRTLTQVKGGEFPNMSADIEFFKTAFDHDQALKDGVIAPEPGVDADHDAIEAKIESINDELKEYLKSQEAHFGCRIAYFGTDKKRYQLEIPDTHARKANSDYELQGKKKGSQRFHTEETKSLLAQMLQAESERKVVLKDLSRRIFEKFSNNYATWRKCVELVAALDVCSSLAEYARNQNTTCVPDLVENDGSGPVFEIENSYHPCVPAADVFIPNSIILGNAEPPMALLTGPNMGGKSTLMRQVGLLAVMAQIGSRLPADSCKMSLIDRIFTRLGANDDIMAGQSTFLVELSETSAILKHATVNSLVLLDELGRGTATYDGTAIAGAVVNFLADLKCRSLFSTHYHNLVDNFHNDKRVALGHMACMVENDDPNEDPTEETVTFLYKYTDGACPKSYGFNAAKLAGMPHGIIKRAHELSKRVESIALHRKLLSKILNNATETQIIDLILKVKGCAL